MGPYTNLTKGLLVSGNIALCDLALILLLFRILSKMKTAKRVKMLLCVDFRVKVVKLYLKPPPPFHADGKNWNSKLKIFSW